MSVSIVAAILSGAAQAGPVFFACRIEQVLVAGSQQPMQVWRNPIGELYKSSPVLINRVTGDVRFIALGRHTRRGNVKSDDTLRGHFQVHVPSAAGERGAQIKVVENQDGTTGALQLELGNKLLLGSCS